ncbi:peroxisomal membrane protein PEX14 isoform X2 [Euphorbia lathyris]|uniref:peroxisomal membrane protein PEX14 isoform X2 n=1 Tax=Euphorbia lathyris TaxID=212925 RepID=UPI003313BDF7
MATQSSPPPTSSSSDEKPQNPEPVREEQVQNAVKFLSHPKVRGSPVMYRRSFLERKGLTKEEIDEAFRRVPDPPPSSQATGTTQEAQVKSSPNVQPSAQTQALQPAAATPAGAISSVGTLRRYQFHWYHAVVAVGLLAASGAGTALLVKNTIIPRLKSWIRKVVLEEDDDSGKKIDAKPSLAEEAAAAAKAAAAAAADVAKASQEMLNSKNEEKRYFEEFMNLLDVQVKEMKSMGTAIRKLEGQNNNLGRTLHVDQDDYTFSAANQSRQTYVNGKAESDSRSVRSSSPPTSTEPSVAPHPKSYAEIMAMVQRGERPPNIKDINDQPPNPNQQISNPRLAPRSKPWELGQSQNSSSQLLQSQVNGERFGSKVQENGLNHLADGESAVPWWQQKNARITEIENEDQLKAGSVTTRTPEQPIQRTWVPPLPPPVVMPEAAEAIRRPKPSVQKEQLSEDQSASQPADATDELQRITKIAESGGELEYNGGVSELNSSEITEEQELNYLGN